MTIEQLKKDFDTYYSKAVDAIGRKDYYNIVINLRAAANCQLQMAELATDVVEKYQYNERAKEYLKSAKKWESDHPEAFANTNQGGSGTTTAPKFTSNPKTDTTFDDIVGCEDVKRFVKTQYIDRFSEKYQLVFANGRGGNLERGMLLFGLPGTGKTMIARAIANAVDADFIVVKASDLKDRFHGETEKKIQELYDNAALSGKVTVIFIDEIETLIPSRSGTDIQNYEASAVTQFLAVLDGFDKEKVSNIITIAASNYPNRIDSAAIRPGRLGAWFRVDLPAASLRQTLFLKQFGEGYTMDKDAVQYVVQKTRGFSSADVVAICNRIKAKLVEKGMKAVDDGLSREQILSISSAIDMRTVEEVLKTSNSSVSKSAIVELAAFEANYNYKSSGGTLLEFMEKLT